MILELKNKFTLNRLINLFKNNSICIKKLANFKTMIPYNTFNK